MIVCALPLTKGVIWLMPSGMQPISDGTPSPKGDDIEAVTTSGFTHAAILRLASPAQWPRVVPGQRLPSNFLIWPRNLAPGISVITSTGTGRPSLRMKLSGDASKIPIFPPS